VAGRPGMGKTSLALNIALHAAKIGRAPLVFSMEMSESQLTQRLIAAESGIPSQRLRLGEIANDEWPAYGKAVGELSKHKLLIDDTPALSVMELKTKARREHARLSNGLNLIVVDYIQLMRGDGKSETRHQEVSYISRSLKGLARELNVPILALSQLSRKCESRHDKRPMLSDLAESGTIEQAADIIMFIYRDEIYNPDTEFPNIAEIIVGKHRHGPTGIFSTYFKKAITQFCDLEVRTQPLNY
jgi:replicative DNA helicase